MKRASSSGVAEGGGCGSGRNQHTKSPSGGGDKKRSKLQLDRKGARDSSDPVMVERATHNQEPAPAISYVDVDVVDGVEEEGRSFSQISSTSAAPSSTFGMFSPGSVLSVSPVRYHLRAPSINMDVTGIAGSQQEVDLGPGGQSADAVVLSPSQLETGTQDIREPIPDGTAQLQSSMSSPDEQVQSPFQFSMRIENQVRAAAVHMNSRTGLGLGPGSDPGLAHADDLLAALPPGPD